VHKTGNKEGDPVGHSVFTTTDGMAIAITVFHPPVAASVKPGAGSDVLVQFAVTGSGKTKTEADRLEQKVAGWTYQLGAWKEASLLPGVDTLKAPEPAQPPAPANQGAAMPAGQ